MLASPLSFSKSHCQVGNCDDACDENEIYVLTYSQILARLRGMAITDLRGKFWRDGRANCESRIYARR